MKKIIATEHAPKAVATYSQAIEVNGTLYISGQIAIDPLSGKMIDGDVKAQTERVLKNIEAVLIAAGYTYKDVVKTTCLLSNINDYQAMNEVYGKIFFEEAPARAAFAVSGLPLGALVEI